MEQPNGPPAVAGASFRLSLHVPLPGVSAPRWCRDQATKRGSTASNTFAEQAGLVQEGRERERADLLFLSDMRLANRKPHLRIAELSTMQRAERSGERACGAGAAGATNDRLTFQERAGRYEACLANSWTAPYAPALLQHAAVGIHQPVTSRMPRHADQIANFCDGLSLGADSIQPATIKTTEPLDRPVLPQGEFYRARRILNCYRVLCFGFPLPLLAPADSPCRDRHFVYHLHIPRKVPCPPSSGIDASFRRTCNGTAAG